MASKKLTPEEELEKQYCDYKAQFEQWKIKNSDSVGSEAYIRYVKQFEEWEKDVEKRRAAVRQKAEQERMAAERDAKREAELRQKQNEEAAAKAYAEEQASYVAMHQRAMQVEQNARSRLSAGKHNLTQVSPRMGYGSPSIDQNPSVRSRAQPTFGPSTIQAASQAAEPVSADNSMVTVMQQMLSFVMGTDKPKNGDATDMNGTQVPAEVAAAQPEPATPPQLWGSDGASYPVTDPMFIRWNVRAAPPNFRADYQPPPSGIPVAPYWMSLNKMAEAKLVLAPQLNVPPPVPPSLMQTAPFSMPPPNLNMPPPTFKT